MSEAKPVDMEKMQQGIDALESRQTFPNLNALFKALAGTKWATKNGYSVGFIYRKITESLQSNTPIRMKTKPGRIRKGGMSEMAATTQKAEPKKRAFEALPRPGESPNEELQRLRIENEDLKLRFSVYHRDDVNEIFQANPHTVVKCAANGNATANKVLETATPYYESMLDGLVAAQKLIEEYRNYTPDHALNPDDKRRVAEATTILNAFFKTTRLSKLELNKRQ